MDNYIFGSVNEKMDIDLTNNYFPELDNIPIVYDDKYGILNVGLVKNEKVVTGYQWNYKYYDAIDSKIRFFHSYDLRKLRKKVLNHGFEWIITDNQKAIESYKFNNNLMKKHNNHVRKYNSKYRGSSGVLHVSKQLDKRYKNKYTWRYCYEGVICSSKSLALLKEKVMNKQCEWVVKDNELYQWNLDNEPFLKKV